MLMAMFDSDRSGTIGFNEFAGLWKYIKGEIASITYLVICQSTFADWQGVFKHFDKDRSGSIEELELEQALRQFGFNLSPRLIMILQVRFRLSLVRRD